MHLAEQDTKRVSDDDLYNLCLSAEIDEAELFYRGLVVLLKRQRLDLARDAALQAGERYNDHPVLNQIMNTVLSDGAGVSG